MANWFNKEKSDVNEKPIISENSRFYIMRIETYDSDGYKYMSDSVDFNCEKRVKFIAIEEDGVIREFVTGIPIVLKSKVEEMFANFSFTALRELNCIGVDELVPTNKIEVARSLSLLSDYATVERYRERIRGIRDHYKKNINSRIDKIEADKKREDYIIENADSIINGFAKKYRIK